MNRLGLRSTREFSRRCGFVAETHAHALLKRLDEGQDIHLATALKLAHGIGRSLTWLATGREEQSGVMLCDVHGWTEAEAEARARYPEIPDFAISAVRSMRIPGADRIDAVAIRDFARAWFDVASPDARRRAERSHVLGETGTKM